MQNYSPRFSFQGWSFWKWLKGNWTTIKEMMKVLLPAAIGWTATNNPELTGLVTIGGKFLLDLGEYYLKENLNGK